MKPMVCPLPTKSCRPKKCALVGTFPPPPLPNALIGTLLFFLKNALIDPVRVEQRPDTYEAISWPPNDHPFFKMQMTLLCHLPHKKPSFNCLKMFATFLKKTVSRFYRICFVSWSAITVNSCDNNISALYTHKILKIHIFPSHIN